MESLAANIPQVKLCSGDGSMMPCIGLGTALYPFGQWEVTKSAILQAIRLGYRHFDTASVYLSEQPLGEAIAEALRLGLVKSRDELFITSKLWCKDAHRHLVLPALRKTLRKIQLDYLDLYLIHWPVSMKPGELTMPVDVNEDLLPMDIKATWESMEECQRLGLAKSIGVSNFTCKKLAELLSMAKVVPAVNQVEMHPMWQQKKLRQFCVEKGIRVCAYSPLGGRGTPWGANKVLESEVLKEIAERRSKTIPQVCLRWIYEQGAIPVVKSVCKQRMEENMAIFDWKLNEEDLQRIDQLPQQRIVSGLAFVSVNGLYKSLEEVWDGEI